MIRNRSILGNDEVLQEGVSDSEGILAVTVLSTMQQGACGMIVRIRLFVNALQNDIPQTRVGESFPPCPEF